MKKIFIDGSAGTTGLRIYERLQNRLDVEILSLPEEKRKDVLARKEMLNSADVAFLCLPDDAARESVSLVENPDVTVIDASTAHRTLPDWAYGFPELSKAHEEKILSSKRIAVPGCHASGFISLVYPLIEAGYLAKETLLTCHSITGYSGGGKNMIKQYEAADRKEELGAPYQYANRQQHKHLKEMTAICGLENQPMFCPIVSDFYSGMLVTVPLFQKQLKKGNAEDIKKLYAEKYNGNIVKYQDVLAYEERVGKENLTPGFMSSVKNGNTDTMQIFVDGNDERILLMSAYDNLGKGASGAAIECMNMVIGAKKEEGLLLKRE